MSEQPGQSEPLTHWDRITRGAPLDFRNSDHIQSVLEEGNEEQVEALKQATGMDNNDVAIRRPAMRRVQALHQQREIEPCRTTADADDAHEAPPCRAARRRIRELF